MDVYPPLMTIPIETVEKNRKAKSQLWAHHVDAPLPHIYLG